MARHNRRGFSAEKQILPPQPEATPVTAMVTGVVVLKKDNTSADGAFASSAVFYHLIFLLSRKELTSVYTPYIIHR